MNLGAGSSGGKGRQRASAQLRDQGPVQWQPDGWQGLHRPAGSAARRCVRDQAGQEADQAHPLGCG